MHILNTSTCTCMHSVCIFKVESVFIVTIFVYTALMNLIGYCNVMCVCVSSVSMHGSRM